MHEFRNIDWEINVVAWEFAWRQRCCPPVDVLLTEKDSKEVKDHLTICPYCQKEQEIADQYDADLLLPFEDALKEIQKGSESPENPSPGQLWCLKDKYNGWGPKFRWYKSPTVLIISIDDIQTNAIKVCQVYNDITFMGTDDIRLGENSIYFAETWNSYTLKKESFFEHLLTVDESIFHNILDSIENNQFIRTDENSVLSLFREIEIDTGFFFSAQAVAELMEESENTRPA